MSSSALRIEVKAGCIRVGHKIGKPQQQVWLEVNSTGAAKHLHPFLCMDPIPKQNGYRSRLNVGQRAFEPNGDIVTWLDRHTDIPEWSTLGQGKGDLALRSKKLVAVLKAVFSGQIKSYATIQREDDVEEQVELTSDSVQLRELANKFSGKLEAPPATANNSHDSSETSRRLSKNLENRARDKARHDRKHKTRKRRAHSDEEGEDADEVENDDEEDTEVTRRPKSARTSRQTCCQYSAVQNTAVTEAVNEPNATATNEGTDDADDLISPAAANNISNGTVPAAAVRSTTKDPQLAKLMAELNAQEKELNAEEEKWAQLLAQKVRLSEQRKRIEDHKKKLMQG